MPRKTITTIAPTLKSLSEKECHALLARNHVGRIAFVYRGQVDITPVHYVTDDLWLFVRSDSGAKMRAFAHNPYVAFEVDEIDGTFDWRSVVAHGTVYVLSEAQSTVDLEAYDRALGALRRVTKAALTAKDPTPARRIVYGIHVDRVTGRAASTRGRR